MTDGGKALGDEGPDPRDGPPETQAESLRQFRSLVNASPAAIVGLDRQGRVTTWNPAAERIFGWSAKEALGATPPPFVPEDREAEFSAHMEDVLGGQVRQDQEVERMRRDGSRIPLHLAYAPVRDEAGKITGVMAVLSDISEVKETAEQLDQVQERYEARAMEAKARQEVLRSTAHEISNPLTPMRFQVEILRSLAGTGDKAKQNEALDVLERNLQRVSRLVDDLKDAARLEGGKLRVNPGRVELCELVAEVAEGYRQVAAEAGLSVEVELPTEATAEAPVEVQADRTRIEQVLANLLANAIKFTPEGGTVRVQVTTRGAWAEAGGSGTHLGSARTDAGSARISVSDTGAGMTDAQIQALFEPFSQVHEAIAEEGGTGLGLYITRGIVEAHDGRIWCESPGPGQGATFHVTLPVGEG